MPFPQCQWIIIHSPPLPLLGIANWLSFVFYFLFKTKFPGSGLLRTNHDNDNNYDNNDNNDDDDDDDNTFRAEVCFPPFPPGSHIFLSSPHILKSSSVEIQTSLVKVAVIIFGLFHLSFYPEEFNTSQIITSIYIEQWWGCIWVFPSILLSSFHCSLTFHSLFHRYEFDCGCARAEAGISRGIFSSFLNLYSHNRKQVNLAKGSTLIWAFKLIWQAGCLKKGQNRL